MHISLVTKELIPNSAISFPQSFHCLPLADWMSQVQLSRKTIGVLQLTAVQQLVIPGTSSSRMQALTNQ